MVTQEMRMAKMEEEVGHEDRADFDPRRPFANRAAHLVELAVRRRDRDLYDGLARVPFQAKETFKRLVGGRARWNQDSKTWSYCRVLLSMKNHEALVNLGVTFL